MRKYPFMNRERIFTFSIGEDWSGLHKMVREDYYVPNRAEVLSILDCDPDAAWRALRSPAVFREVSSPFMGK